MIEQQFVEFVVGKLVDHPDQVSVKRTEDDRGVLLELSVAPDDLGRVIGRRERRLRVCAISCEHLGRRMMLAIISRLLTQTIRAKLARRHLQQKTTRLSILWKIKPLKMWKRHLVVPISFARTLQISMILIYNILSSKCARTKM